MRWALCVILLFGFSSVVFGTSEFIDNQSQSSSSDQSPSSSAATPSTLQSSSAAAISAEPAAAPDPLGEATRLYRKGDFDGAVQKYQQLLQEKPNSPDIFAGLTHVYLKKKDVKEANDIITKGVQVADSPRVRVALGEVYFRQGKIREAEQEWVNVIKLGTSGGPCLFGIGPGAPRHFHVQKWPDHDR